MKPFPSTTHDIAESVSVLSTMAYSFYKNRGILFLSAKDSKFRLLQVEDGGLVPLMQLILLTYAFS